MIPNPSRTRLECKSVIRLFSAPPSWDIATNLIWGKGQLLDLSRCVFFCFQIVNLTFILVSFCRVSFSYLSSRLLLGHFIRSPSRWLNASSTVKFPLHCLFLFCVRCRRRGRVAETEIVVTVYQKCAMGKNSLAQMTVCYLRIYDWNHFCNWALFFLISFL